MTSRIRRLGLAAAIGVFAAGAVGWPSLAASSLASASGAVSASSTWKNFQYAYQDHNLQERDRYQTCSQLGRFTQCGGWSSWSAWFYYE